MSQKTSNKLLIAIVVGALVFSLDLLVAWSLVGTNSWEVERRFRNLGWQVDSDVIEPLWVPCCLLSPAFAAIAGAMTFKIVGTRWQKPVLISLLGLVLLIATLYIISLVGWRISLLPPTPTPIPWEPDL